jgi:hypothetical protein
MKLDPKGKYLIQDEAYHGQKIEDRLYVFSLSLAKRKDMKPYDPVNKETVNDLKTPDPTPKESIELQGITFEVEPELHKVLARLIEYIEQLESLNRNYKDALAESDKKAISNVQDNTQPEQTNISDDQNDTPEPKPKSKKSRRQSSK